MSLILIVILLLSPTQIHAENNNVKSGQSYETKLKSNFGCTPAEEWTPLRQSSSSSFASNVCITRSYQIDKGPEIENTHSVWVKFGSRKILEIEERKKFVTISIAMKVVWKDSRLWAKVSDLETPNKLSSITKTEQQIWFPLVSPWIKGLKELTPRYDPIIARDVYLGLGSSVNALLGVNSFQANDTFVFAIPAWKVKIFCNFDFSNYPFDEQICPLEMGAAGLNITLYGKGYRNTRQLVDEFAIKTEATVFKLSYNEVLKSTYFDFGINYEMKRKLNTYIYRYFLPSSMIVAMSFFSLMIPLSALPGRVAMIVTLFLTLTNIFIHHMDESPSGSQLNMLSIYLLTSLIFVFGTMIELALVLLSKRIIDLRYKASILIDNGTNRDCEFSSKRIGIQVENQKMNDIEGNSDSKEEAKHDSQHQRKGKLKLLRHMSFTEKVDSFAYILLSISYSIFNLIYFIVNV